MLPNNVHRAINTPRPIRRYYNLIVTAICLTRAIRADIFEFDAGHGYVFSKNSVYFQILHQCFWLMQMDLYLALELSIGNYLGIKINERKMLPSQD